MSCPFDRAIWLRSYTFPMSDEVTHAATIDHKHFLSMLQAAAEDLANTRTIDHDKRKAVTSDAHQLAHALDQDGRPEAASKAYEVIATLEHAGLPQPERLQEQVAELAALLEE